MEDSIKGQTIVLEDRKTFTCELVENVESFTDEQILIKTKLGGIDIKGSEFKLADFSVDNGTIVLEGKIDSIVFVNIKEKRSFFKGLFK